MEVVYLDTVEPLHFRGIIRAHGRDYPFSYKIRLVKDGAWYTWKGRFIFDIVENLPNLKDAEYDVAAQMVTIALFNKQYPFDIRNGSPRTQVEDLRWNGIRVQHIAIGICIILFFVVFIVTAAL